MAFASTSKEPSGRTPDSTPSPQENCEACRMSSTTLSQGTSDESFVVSRETLTTFVAQPISNQRPTLGEQVLSVGPPHTCPMHAVTGLKDPFDVNLDIYQRTASMLKGGSLETEDPRDADNQLEDNDEKENKLPSSPELRETPRESSDPWETSHRSERMTVSYEELPTGRSSEGMLADPNDVFEWRPSIGSQMTVYTPLYSTGNTSVTGLKSPLDSKIVLSQIDSSSQESCCDDFKDQDDKGKDYKDNYKKD